MLLPATALLEPRAFSQTHALVAASPGFLVWLSVNSFMAYAVNLTNFMVTKYTSALTLQVRGGLMQGEEGRRGGDQQYRRGPHGSRLLAARMRPLCRSPPHSLPPPLTPRPRCRSSAT
jgi:hypothetical protein